LQEHRRPTRSAALRNVSLEELSGELLARIHDGVFSSESTILLGCRIQDALRSALDIHCNRMSVRHHRDLFGEIYDGLGPLLFDVDDATIVEVGCGSINPFGRLFLFLMLGARRGIAIDLDEIRDRSRAVRTLADYAGIMMTAPAALVDDFFIRPEEVFRNLASFDLARMSAGDPSGIDRDRLRHQRESIGALSLREGEADLVISNSLLEHVEGVDEAIAELARVTRHGGLGVHRIDGSDHRRYLSPGHHPLEFLKEPAGQGMVQECNRIRPCDFAALFERHGFEVITATPYERLDITTDLRDSLAEPFRSKPEEILGVLALRLVVRRSEGPARRTTRETKWWADPVSNGLIADAWKEVHAGRYAEALARLLEAPETHPKYYYALALRGYVRYRMEDFEGAEQDLARALALTERRPEAFLYRAWLRLAQNRIDDGASDALRAQELINKGHWLEAEVLDVLGQLHSRQGRHSEAMQAFDHLMALQPKRPKLHVHRSVALHIAGLHEEAAAELVKAVTLEPSEAWKLIDDARYAQALEGLLETPTTHPEHYHAVALCGYVRYRMEDFEGAERDLGRALALTEGRPEAFLYRAWLRLALDRIDEGTEDALRAQALIYQGHWLETEVLDVLGQLYNRQGRYSQALQAFDRLMALQPMRPMLHLHRGSALVKAGRHDEARAEIERALALDPSDEAAMRLRELL
jgi:Flp pilus assembly protein TadD/SAM-dependent methyltransferase